jgi:predicted GIY-YIG superfamily endonuclease
MSEKWFCYLIRSKSYPNHTYIGSSPDVDKRLQKHNKLLPGGAKATRKHNDWELVKSVERPNKSSALSLEYYWKHYKTKTGTWRSTRPGIDNKLKRLGEIL